MFTGLIKEVGIIKAIEPNSTGKVFTIECPHLIEDINIDDSVATNGVCLTATKIKDNTFKAQAVHVTLEKTTLGKLKVGSKVNLELALRPIDRLGGHLVQGHVNGLGKISKINQLGDNWEISFTVDKKLKKYIIKEGSICLDGISLTIARINNEQYTVSIIPHTYTNTIIHTKSIGDEINIEVDMMAKYLENFMKYEKNDKSLMQLLQE